MAVPGDDTESDAVRRIAHAHGVSVYWETSTRSRIDISPSGTIEAHLKNDSGVAVRRDGSYPVELASPAPALADGGWQVAQDLCGRLATLPAGRYLVDTAAAIAAVAPDAVPAIGSRSAALHRAHGSGPSGYQVRLISEAVSRRIVVCLPEGTPHVKVESWARLSCFARDPAAPAGGKHTEIMTPVARPGAMDILRDQWVTPELAERVVTLASEQAARLSGATPTPAGTLPVIFAPGAAGTVAHELVGHLLERDNIDRLAGRCAVEVGDRIGQDLLQVIHDGTADHPWCGAEIDDEATPTSRRMLVRDGLVVGHLTTRSSGAPGRSPAGHARRAGYDAAVLPRIGCVVIPPGTDDPEEMVDVPRGLLVNEISQAAMDPSTGQWAAQLREAALIENGQITQTLAGGRIASGISATLTAIDRVGPGSEFSAALCTKQGQILPTGAVAPYLRLSQVAVR